jgi:DNA-binding NarL/FixJ family response regulator
METALKVLIADDHPIFREGLARTIEREPAFTIVAQCDEGNEALRLIRELRPDIAVLDISMPMLSGLEIIQSARRERLTTAFVILTMYKDERYFNEAIDAGVRGYVLKDCVATELVASLRAVARGDYYISPAMSALLIDRNTKLKSLSQILPALDSLTPTERRVLRLLSLNKTSKEIADELFVSVRTVENHRAHICTKLGLKGHNQLLLLAIGHRSLL